jgi:hypothetical protein
MLGLPDRLPSLANGSDNRLRRISKKSREQNARFRDLPISLAELAIRALNQNQAAVSVDDETHQSGVR